MVWESDEQSIPERFAKVVAACPDRPAVESADAGLSYTALNEAANRVAHRVLTDAPNSAVIAVLAGQGVSVIVAVLGVLKTGKMLVCLDPRQPPARMIQILSDCGAQLLLTDEESFSRAKALRRPGIRLLNIDALKTDPSLENPGLSIAPDASASLMYTSGSTGQPKGVIQTHRNYLQKTGVFSQVFQIVPHDRIALLSSCSVGLGMSTMLQALLNGASLHMFDLHQQGIGALATWLTSRKVTIYSSMTSTFRHFLKSLPHSDRFAKVRAIRLGGEAMLDSDLALIRQHFSHRCVIVNGFSATETGPVTTYVVDHATEITGTVPAGYALDGAKVLILDDAGRECPAGEQGEIVVESRYLSPGYWHDPDRTAAAFSDGPNGMGARRYRTGDLGVLRPDGCLEHRGRKDLRVKVRGFRIELEEIERQLQAHPLVHEAAVIAATGASGNSRLAAYVVQRHGAHLAADDLRAHLKETLPEQMVPPTFEFVPALPRTVSGKVNRNALAAPRMGAAADATASEPCDAVELCLKNIWEGLLEHRPISVSANFFESGGDSLLAARLGVEVERTFHWKLPMSAFLQAATIRQQAQLLRTRRAHTNWPSLVPIRPNGSKPPLFCVHLVDGNVLAYRDVVRHLPADQPVYGLQSRGLDRVSPLNMRLEDMARDYVSEIRRFQPDGPYAICGWSFGGVVAFEMARQLEQDGQRVALLVVFDSHVPGRLHIDESGRSLPMRRSRARRIAGTLLRSRRRIKHVRRLCGKVVWRTAARWQRSGGWLPRVLQNLTEINRSALRQYVPHAYRGRLTLFKAAEHRSQRLRDPLFGWGPFVGGGLEIHQVPGHHKNMVFEPHARTLADTLGRCLAEAWEPHKDANGRVA